MPIIRLKFLLNVDKVANPALAAIVPTESFVLLNSSHAVFILTQYTNPVPGIGVKSAQKIVGARKYGRLTFEDLQKMRVVLKRALYFITCGGKMMYRTKMEENYILRNILDPREKLPVDPDITYQQLSFFDTGKGWLEIHE